MVCRTLCTVSFIWKVNKTPVKPFSHLQHPKMLSISSSMSSLSLQGVWQTSQRYTGLLNLDFSSPLAFPLPAKDMLHFRLRISEVFNNSPKGFLMSLCMMAATAQWGHHPNSICASCQAGQNIFRTHQFRSFSQFQYQLAYRFSWQCLNKMTIGCANKNKSNHFTPMVDKCFEIWVTYWWCYFNDKVAWDLMRYGGGVSLGSSCTILSGHLISTAPLLQH